MPHYPLFLAYSFVYHVLAEQASMLIPDMMPAPPAPAIHRLDTRITLPLSHSPQPQLRHSQISFSRLITSKGKRQKAKGKESLQRREEGKRRWYSSPTLALDPSYCEELKMPHILTATRKELIFNN